MNTDYLKENFDKISKLPEFDNHHSVINLNNLNSNLKGFIVIHRKNQNVPSFGATRLWHYIDEIDALRDALRLSKMMSYKSALAGLRYGGAKGVVIVPWTLSSEEKKKTLEEYTKIVNDLKGGFVTGTDVGLTQEDLLFMKEISPFMVGSCGDPTIATALGVYCSIQVCLQKVFGYDSIKGRAFAIQGMGKIGRELLKLIYKDTGDIFVSDIDSTIIDSVKNDFPRVFVVSPEEIHKQTVDVFSPCALSYSINAKTLTELKCKIIVGGANNQLENDEIGKALLEKGILYAPDYVANAGGLINVVDEFENSRCDENRIKEKVLKIKDRINEIIDVSVTDNKPTNIIADNMAGKVMDSQ